MLRVRQACLLLLRLVLAFVVMLVAYVLGTMVIDQTNTAMTPEEAGQAGQALLLVSLFSALVLSFLIMRSGWHGLKLIGAVIIVHFGVETFMTQIETLTFNRALQMGTAELSGIVAAGAVRALVFEEDPLILPFQLLRGALWALLAMAVVRLTSVRRGETSLTVALTFAVLLSVPLALFPNPYMSPAVRQAHFFELLSSMLVFGGTAGWVLHGSERVEGATRQSALVPQS